jgi:hypothetical protein
MRHDRTGIASVMAALICASASAITITGLTPSTAKVKVGQPITFTLAATGVPSAGPPLCFFTLTPGDGTSALGPEVMPSGFVAGSAVLKAFSYSKAGAFTVTVAPRGPYHSPQNPLLTSYEDGLVAQGVKPCDGSAAATVTVWDPYSAPGRLHGVNLPPPPAGQNGTNPPGPGPVEMTKVRPGAVALNPQPLPPGAHTESLKTGGAAVVVNHATMLTRVPFVRAVSVSPPTVHEGQPAQLAITADPGCNAVLITWGDGTTQDQSLAPHGQPLERPIQHVYRKVGAETVKVSGEHGCYGQATAALSVTFSLQRPMGGTAQVVHR